MNQEIYETKSCRGCKNTFHITNADIEFYEKASPIFGWKKHSIPTPTLCPACRNNRRLAFRNERNLYKRKCDATGEDIISIYSPESEYTVYNMNMWLSDRWDGIDYGTNIDFTKPIIPQFDVLLKQVPRIPSFQFENENSEYTNGSQKNKDCYMIFVSDYNQDCAYTNGTFYSEDSLDCLGLNKSLHCYECIDTDNCRNCFYSQDLIWCNDVYFSKKCENCNHCYFCDGLINKEYCINNIQYTKEEYFDKIKNLQWVKDKAWEWVHLYYHWANIEWSTWDFIRNAKNALNCFESQEIEDCKNMTYWVQIKNCHDGYVVVDNSENCYEIVSCIANYNSLFVYCSWNNNRCYYVDTCENSEDLFLCAGLKNKRYCIMNKQYTKEEYLELVPKIIAHMKETWEWWEFFSTALSPFWYNETVAQEYYPLTQEEAVKRWYKWNTYEAPFPKVEKIIPAEKLPNDISGIPDDILAWAIECEITKKPFRIIGPELDFYRKHNLPIPKRHPDQRHLDRMNLRNPRKLYERNCDKCSKNIESTYAPERKETVYCEECYNKEIY